MIKCEDNEKYNYNDNVCYSADACNTENNEYKYSTNAYPKICFKSCKDIDSGTWRKISNNLELPQMEVQLSRIF